MFCEKSCQTCLRALQALRDPTTTKMPSETDVAPKALSGTGWVGWDWVGNLQAKSTFGAGLELDLGVG